MELSNMPTSTKPGDFRSGTRFSACGRTFAGVLLAAAWLALSPIPALGQTGSGNPSQVLMGFGYASTPEGLREAFATGSPPTVISALNAAAFVRSDALKDRAIGLLRSPNFALQLAAGKYLGSIGVPEGAQWVRSFAEAPREYVLEDQNLQLLVIDAAREVARNGHVDYAFQLPLLIEQGNWQVKTFAAQALRDFRKPDDAMVEESWLRAISLYREGIDHDDAGVRRDAALFMQVLLDSARTLEAVSKKVVDEFVQLAAAGGAPIVGPDGKALDFAGVAGHLKTCEVRNPLDKAPGIDPPPRVVGQTAAERLLNIIDKGPFDTLPADLDNNGVFEGLNKTDWMEKVEREANIPRDDVESRYQTRTVRTSQPSSYEVRVEIDGDQYDPHTRTWTAMLFRFRVTWWGYGWHFSGFDRVANPTKSPDMDSIPEPVLDARYPKAHPVVLALVRGLSESDLDALASIVAEDASINDGAMSKAEFLAQMEALFEQTRGQVAIRPVAYTFKAGEEPSKLHVEVELRSYARLRNRMLRVFYTLELEEREGALLITSLGAQSRRFDR